MEHPTTVITSETELSHCVKYSFAYAARRNKSFPNSMTGGPIVKRSLLFIYLILQSTLSFALTKPGTDPNSRSKTTQQYPILQCPATNEVMKDFRKKIMELKTSIKAEAQCAPIQANVGKLSDLVTKDREGFLKLISQGESQGLSTADMQTVQNYVSDLTTTTSDLFNVLSGNDACFAEDKQGTSLSFITSLVGEGSKILALVGGPVGGTVSVAANLITGFLNGMEQVKKNRRGYKFEVTDQRIAYAETLCSFFEYRRELDNLLNPYESISNLTNLSDLIDQQLNVLYKSCPECAAMIDTVDAQIALGNDTTTALWTDAFEKNLIISAEAIDKTYTRKLGTHTYRSLKTRTWIPERVAALQSTQLKADLGLQDVLGQMVDIENFLLDRQVGYFLDYLSKDAVHWRRSMLQQVSEGRQLVSALKLDLIKVNGIDTFPETYYEAYGYNWEMDAYLDTDKFYKYVGAVIETLDSAKTHLNINDRAKVNSYFKKLDDLTRGLKVSVDVVDNYCTFFALANWYSPNISAQCEAPSMNQMKMDVAEFTSMSPNIMLTNISPLPAQLAPTEVSAAADLTPTEQEKIAPGRAVDLTGSGQTVQATTADANASNISFDWVQSLTQSVRSMTKDPKYVIRSK
jgi:hypothetical protein